MTMVDARVEAY